MVRKMLPVLILLGVGFGLGVLWNSGAMIPRASAQAAAEGPAAVAAAPSPVVGCTPLQSVTEYEEDPFNPDRVRRTRTTVSSVVLVHADGTTEAKRVAY